MTLTRRFRFLPGLLFAAIFGSMAWWGWPRTGEALGQEPGSIEDKPAIRRPEAAPTVSAAPTAPKTEAPPAPVEKKAPAAKAPEPAADAEEPAPGGIPPGMAALFPVGRVFQGVRIPSYSGDTLGSVIHSQYMKRADDEHLEMETLEIVVFQGGKASTRILTDRAIFDITTKTLRSTTSARIIQDQFEMKGDRLLFDSQSRIGHLSGHVKTVIHDPEALQTKTQDPVTPPAPEK
jgi:hypothetical protein